MDEENLSVEYRQLPIKQKVRDVRSWMLSKDIPTCPVCRRNRAEDLVEPLWLIRSKRQAERAIAASALIDPSVLDGRLMATVKPDMIDDPLWMSVFVGASLGAKASLPARLKACRAAAGEYWKASDVGKAIEDTWAWNSEYYAAILLDSLATQKRILRALNYLETMHWRKSSESRKFGTIKPGVSRARP